MTITFPPIDQLALNIAAAPGQCLLILGSGISRASGIPTGWEITLDLVRRVAGVRNEDVSPADAADWFSKTFGEEPRYSDVLQMAGPTKQARQQLIRSYFERSADEPEESKRPTKAHRAIANLVRGEFIKLIVTTNFDRLMESALEEVGIAPVVIASPAQFLGAAPLHRNTCTVVKLHGDYLDPEILNIDAELANYTVAMDQLLDRAFDEYGIVTCGWSADYDVALRAAIERRTSRRFASYWTHITPVQGNAANLLAGQAITPIPIANADAFFTELDSKVQAAAAMSGPHPMSEALTVAEAKRALSHQPPLIAFRDMAMRVLRTVEADLESSGVLSARGAASPIEITRRIRVMLEITRPLRRVFENAVFFREVETLEATVTCFRRLLAVGASHRQGVTVFLHANRTVPMALHAAIGIAAAASGNYRAFRQILELPDPRREERGIKVARSYYLRTIAEDRGLIAGRERDHTPLSDLFAEELRNEFRDLVPDDNHYEHLFDRYEVLVGLAYLTPTSAADQIPTGVTGQPWAPFGRFAWRRDPDHRGGSLWQRMKDEAEEQGALWPPVVGGMFRGSAEVAGTVFESAVPFFDRVAHELSWR